MGEGGGGRGRPPPMPPHESISERDRTVIRWVNFFALLVNRFEFCNFASIRKYSMKNREVADFKLSSREFVYTGGFGNLYFFSVF